MGVVKCLVVLFLVACVFAEITRPSECDVWRSGFEFEIRWDTDDLADTVDIELYEDGNLFATIASEVENDGSYMWQIPYYDDLRFSSQSDCQFTIFIHSTSGYLPTYVFTGDAVLSEGFNLRSPIIWGNPNNYDPVNVVDTLFKVRWSGEIVPSYEIQYREVGGETISITRTSDRREFEDLDDYVIADVQPATDYEMRMRYTLENGDTSEYTEYQAFRTYENLECTNEMLSGWFSLEVYDNIRTGDRKYPNFCGDIETSFGYVSSSDFVAVYTDRDSGRIFVAWRGTESDNTQDALDNFGLLIDCSFVLPTIGDEACQLSSGYGYNYIASQAKLIRGLIEDAIDAGFDTLVVTGHSQGGALATVSAADYAQRYGSQIDVKLINFGAPELGNEEFVDIVTPTLGTFTRYVQEDESGRVDEVSLLPSSLAGTLLPSDFGFVQFSSNSLNLLECPSDLPVCRIEGPGPIPPFYCHCIEGYFRNVARAAIAADPNYRDNDNYSFDIAIITEWFDYDSADLQTDFEYFYSYIESSAQVTDIISYFSSIVPSSVESTFDNTVTVSNYISPTSNSFSFFSSNSPVSPVSVSTFSGISTFSDSASSPSSTNSPSSSNTFTLFSSSPSGSNSSPSSTLIVPLFLATFMAIAWI